MPSVFDSGFSRPTLAQIETRIQGDLNTRLDGADSRVRRAVLNVMARTLAGAFHLCYGFLDFVARQVFPDSAEQEFLGRWAAIWGVTQKAATKATGTVTITGTNGNHIADGTTLIRSDDVEYVTTAAGTISGGSVVVAIEASEAGEDGNIDSGATLTFASPISGVDAETTAGELSGGTETETDAALLTRLLARIQTPPHGGNANDYEQWALEVSGVTRAWVFPQELADNGVSVRFMMDDTYADGIPQAADVTTVQEYIDDLRPVTADVTVVAPVAVALDFTIDLKKSDGTDETSTTIRDAVEAELADLIRRDAEPGGTIHRSRLIEAISVAAGEHHHNLTVPAADVTHSTGEIAVMGTITWS